MIERFLAQLGGFGSEFAGKICFWQVYIIWASLGLVRRFLVLFKMLFNQGRAVRGGTDISFNPCFHSNLCILYVSCSVTAQTVR